MPQCPSEILLDPSTFVLERRINQPSAVVNALLSRGGALERAGRVALGNRGALSVERPPRRRLGSYDLSWQADARLLTTRGRRVARVVFEIDAVSEGASCFRLRPVARHPERWRGSRLRTYFELAHLTSDYAAGQLDERARQPQLHPAPTLVTASS